MKKVALILRWLIILFSLRLVYLFGRQVWYVIQSYLNGTVERHVFFGIKIPDDFTQTGFLIVSVVSCAILIYLFFLLYVFRKVIQGLIKNQLFISENAEQLVKISKGLFFFGVVLFLIQFVLRMTQSFPAVAVNKGLAYSASYDLGYKIGVTINLLLSNGFPIFIYALFIFIIAKLIKEGNLLKQENDLTI
ncbi:DUF2975 domain-containing protein [Yeosuana marina]|uniref:DUF2975 domain-containing protein n=1 Tax=Yeosuana marina TaxID=1565536 RepID=UPI0030C7F5EB